MDSMIKVEDVSMKFNLGIEKNFSLKLFFINMFKPKKKDEKKGNKDFWALKHVNFEVERGEVVGFVGGNGAGKSTLLKVVSGVMKPTEGKITVAGNICPMIELGAGFDMDLTARENIYLNGSFWDIPENLSIRSLMRSFHFQNCRTFWKFRCGVFQVVWLQDLHSRLQHR